MIHAYDKNYLSRSQNILAVMLDFAVYDLNISLEDFFEKFLNSKISSSFENGNTSVLSGKSGVELALDVINDYSKADSYRPSLDRSPEYWTGWALAYFQWYSGLKFNQINKYIPITEIYGMYNPYHEMDVSQFCDHLNELYASRKPASNLKIKRLEAGISQSELAQMAEVSVRTIQQYEQKQKNINAASTETVIRIAKALNCSVQDLMEL